MRSVLEMLSDRSSAPTLLGCRPSAQKSLGRSQKRFQLLTKSNFCSLHHDNNHLFKANSLLNFSCPRRYMGSGPDTMRGRGRRPGPGLRLSVVSRGRSEGHLGRSCPGCTGPEQRNTQSRDGGSVSSALHTYPGLVSVSPECFQHCSLLPQLGLLCQPLTDLLLTSSISSSRAGNANGL